MHVVSKHLASGKFRAYAYAWRGGPRVGQADGVTKKAAQTALERALGTEDGLAKIAAAQGSEAASKRSPRPSLALVSGLVTRYLDSAEFNKLAARTKKDYRRHLDAYREAFGDWRFSLFEDPRIATDLASWRDEIGGRQGDYRMSVVSALFSWARSRGITTAQPTEAIRKIYQADRSGNIWTDGQLAQLLGHASPEMGWAIRLACETGFRQGDLRALPWSAVSDLSIRFKTSKRGKQVIIPITPAIRTLLNEIPVRSPIILTSSNGNAWSEGGLRSSFRRTKIRARLGELDLTWHDMRGTAVTKLYVAGLRTRDLARIFGWSEDAIEALLARYVSEEEVVKDMLTRMNKEPKL